jgi:hypothetical protein
LLQVGLKQLDYFLITLLVLETIIATIQSYLPGDHILNLYTGGMENSARVGEAVRITGTFSYLGGIGAMSIFYSFYTWYLLNCNRNPIFFFICSLLTCYISLLTGSRGTFFTVIIVIAIAIYENRTKAKQYLTYFIGIAIVAVLIGIFLSNPFQNITRAWKNFDDRLQKGIESGEMEERITTTGFLSVFQYHGDYLLTGAGLGATYQGAHQLLGVPDTVKEYGYMESEPERIVFEGGIFLFLIRIILFVLILSAIRASHLSKWALFFLFINGFIVFNTYMTFFLAMGLLWINSSTNKKLTNPVQNE